MSILESIKKMLGIPEEFTAFDEQLVIHVNSVLSILYQMGVHPTKFVITGEDETWEDYLDLNPDVDIEDVRSYIYLKVRMIFDPPSGGSAAEAFKEQISEFEWRLKVASEEETE